MPLALYALFAAAFAIGTSEFVIAGILPPVADDLGISIPTAGLLVSLYALGVAVGGPFLSLFTSSLSKKKLILTYISIFTIGHVVCALAPSYGVLLALRFSIALVHGAFFGTAMVAGTSLVPEKKRGAAVALLLAGLTVANIVGVPIGTWIGGALGWRWTFWAVAILSAAGLVLVAAFVPLDKGGPTAKDNVVRELKALTREPVFMSLLIIVSQTVGQFALFTYISPVLTEVSGIPVGWVPVLLMLFGIGSTIGVLVGGRLADWKLMPSLVGILAAQLVVYTLMALFVGDAIAMAMLVLLWAALAFAFGAPVQTRILNNARDAPMLASNLIPSAFNIAIAAGAWLGGAMIEGGASYAALPWVGTASVAVALAIAIISWRLGAEVPRDAT
jgi:MFS transporter, DHA1 family, inner membrane transport protein